MHRTAQIVVIGGGVMGASIAFHLARAGARGVLVLEKGTVGSGMSRRSGAIIRTHYTNDPEAQMALASLRVFQNWREIVGGSCGFVQCGFAILVPPQDADRLRRNVARLQRLGVKTEVVNERELARLQPGLTGDEGAVAAYEAESGCADPVETPRAFMARARDLGAAVEEAVAVKAIRTAGGRVCGVDTSAGPVDAPIVVLAAGPWSVRLARTAGVALDIRAQRAQLAFVARPAALAEGHLVLIDGVHGGYCRPFGGDLSLVGKGADREDWADDPDRFDEANDPGFFDEVRTRLRRRLPVLAEQPYVRGHAGLFDMSPDTRAILDQAPGVGGLYLAVGFSGTGFKKSPAVGACLAELILEGRARTVDLRPFRYSRFAENDPIQGPDEYQHFFGFAHRW
jgi:sarcosine oxidase subunit beta